MAKRLIIMHYCQIAPEKPYQKSCKRCLNHQAMTKSVEFYQMEKILILRKSKVKTILIFIKFKKKKKVKSEEFLQIHWRVAALLNGQINEITSESRKWLKICWWQNRNKLPYDRNFVVRLKYCNDYDQNGMIASTE